MARERINLPPRKPVRDFVLGESEQDRLYNAAKATDPAVLQALGASCDPGDDPCDRVWKAMFRSPEGWGYLAHATHGKMPREEAHTWEVRATVLAGLAELERIWAETGAEQPLPRLRDLSAPITREQLYAVVANQYPKMAEPGTKRANPARWFSDVLDRRKKVSWFPAHRTAVVVNLQELQQKFPQLGDGDLDALRRGPEAIAELLRDAA